MRDSHHHLSAPTIRPWSTAGAGLSNIGKHLWQTGIIYCRYVLVFCNQEVGTRIFILITMFGFLFLANCWKALRDKLSTGKVQPKWGKLPSGFNNWISNEILPNLYTNLSSLALLEAKMHSPWWTLPNDVTMVVLVVFGGVFGYGGDGGI